MFLKHFSADVQGKVVGIHHSLHEVQIAREQIVELISDEHLAHVQLQPALVALWIAIRVVVSTIVRVRFMVKRSEKVIVMDVNTFSSH